MNRTLLATIACFLIIIAYACIGAALGWKAGGGAIPALVLMAAISATWKGIRGGGSAAATPEQTNNKSSSQKQDE
jgi:hypothetical protein